MTLKRNALFVFVFIIIGCSEEQSTQPVQSGKITSNEYAVLAAIMDSLFSYLFIYEDTSLILADSTTTRYNENFTYDLERIQQNAPMLDLSTVFDYQSKNAFSAYIDNPLSIHPNFILQSTTQEQLPWFKVSRVGFSLNGKQALAYLEFMVAPLNGGGNYYILSQENSKWKIIAQVKVWIS